MALLEIDKAIEEILKLVKTPIIETVDLSDANGRVIAQDIIANRPQPPFNSSAMDGYAVTLSPDELVNFDSEFEIIGESSAGRSFDGFLKDGQAIRIFTGAAVPIDAKAIIIQEDVERIESKIRFRPEITRDNKTNIRKLGGDFENGEVLIKKNTRLDAYFLSLIAAAGLAKIECYKRPKIAILCNGDELVQIGETPKQDQIFESASFAIMALCERWGAACEFVGTANDDKSQIKHMIANIDCDLLLIIGGASVGDYDLVQPALNEMGFISSFYKVNIKPGKPTWAGRLGEMAVLGLPGNPASALVCAQMFLKPYIYRFCAQNYEHNYQKAFLAHDLKSNGNRVSYSRAIVENINGRMIIKTFANQDSSLIKVFSMSNALLREPAMQNPLKQGDLVEFLSIERMFE